jgi:nucleoside-diphosphate kinase
MLIAVPETIVEQRRTTHMTDNGAPVERTLVLLKPDAVARGMMGRVLTRFEDALLKVVGSKMVWMDADLTRRHYFDLEERFGGSTYPNEAVPGTIRGDFAHQNKAYATDKGIAVANLVHASGNLDEAKQEVALWFTDEELFEYSTVAEKFVL